MIWFERVKNYKINGHIVACQWMLDVAQRMVKVGEQAFDTRHSNQPYGDNSSPGCPKMKVSKAVLDS